MNNDKDTQLLTEAYENIPPKYLVNDIEYSMEETIRRFEHLVAKLKNMNNLELAPYIQKAEKGITNLQAMVISLEGMRNAFEKI